VVKLYLIDLHIMVTAMTVIIEIMVIAITRIIKALVVTEVDLEVEIIKMYL